MNNASFLQSLVEKYPVILTCRAYFPEMFEKREEVVERLEEIVGECGELHEAAVTWNCALNWVFIGVLLSGFVFNLFVLIVLLYVTPKTPTDVYLTSITLGDILICASSTLSTQLPEDFGGLPFLIIIETLANLG